MQLKFKHQKFQEDAAKAVVDVFSGQPLRNRQYMIDQGVMDFTSADGAQVGTVLTTEEPTTGFANAKIELTDDQVLKNMQSVQRQDLIKPSNHLEGKYNLTIEMETGVGKTYTYIKTMYELNKHYGWSKFIVVVPSIAIREGVYKSFDITQEHFAEEYGKKIRYFIYNSTQLTEIDRFASDNSINVMIINSQAFNAKGKDARRIYMELDEFRSRKPIDIIAKTNPIVIIDEPQSVEGAKTKEHLKDFNALFTLRYSATPREYYNLIYRLDAMEAYNKHLVKKISVKGITQTSSAGNTGYLYLQSINISKEAPTATITYDVKGSTSIRKTTRKVNEGFNIYPYSGELEEYRDRYVVTSIDGRDNHIELMNGMKLYAGDVVGEVDEDDMRRIQIRETILSHIERERKLFHRGIKVLSLFFIDEVAKYRKYDEAGQPVNGVYADIFEEEYEDVIHNLQLGASDKEYLDYLDSISASATHAGYFSVDKKGKMIDSKVGRRETESDDIDAYDLIMKNKELLLERDTKKSPVRFIFSHSALREGWDNPNVFQICTLKQSGSDIRKRQEVGRGLRLCVNQDGDRMDADRLYTDVHDVNVLTVIASESYKNFAKELQTELAEIVADRPQKVDYNFFQGQELKAADGTTKPVDGIMAATILSTLAKSGYVNGDGKVLEKYYEDRDKGKVDFGDELNPYTDSIEGMLDTIYDTKKLLPEDARNNNVELTLDKNKVAMPEFQNLWKRINSKTYYTVDFDSNELIDKCVAAINSKLKVSKILFKIETGHMDKMGSRDELKSGASFAQDRIGTDVAVKASSLVKYDLIGEIVEETKLTRKTVSTILQRIEKPVFDQFKNNPAEFILKVGSLINDEKASAIIDHIAYDKLEDKYTTDVFTENTLKGKLGENVAEVRKNLYDYLLYDSKGEEEFAEKLDLSDQVAVYVKLPNGFYINTPLGHYNPDWAITFYEGQVKHIYFVAETKGSMSSMQLRTVEQSKIKCAKEHFKAISNGDVVYDVVDSYEALMSQVMS